jgi:AcrR family transcriptional regulator
VSSAATQPARLRFPGVRPPKPLLPPDAERRLTERQRQVLDSLEELVVGGGLADCTMAEIAGRVNCSLRTLYEISPSKDELVLAVVDRRLHRIGRAAIASLDASLTPLEALRVYLEAVNEAVQPSTESFSRDFADLPGAKRLLDAHEGYVVAVTQSLLERAASERQIQPVDTAAMAHLLGGLGREFARPDVIPLIDETPKRTADALTEIILRGLVSS